MEILLWLLPPVVVTVLAALWVSWLGRDSRGDVDRDVARARLGEAISRQNAVRRPERQVRPAPARQQSSGVAVRRTDDGQTRRSA